MNRMNSRVIASLISLVSSLQFPVSSALAQCTGTWTQSAIGGPAAKPSERNYHAMAYDSARGVTVLFGGITNAGDNAETWEWDGTNWSQKSPALAPSPRNSPGMAYDAARGVTVLFGGYDGADKNDTWEWDGTNWTQSAIGGPAASPSPRSNHAMVYDSDRAVIVLFGGVGAAFYDETWEWDGSNWLQKSPAAEPSARAYHAMAYDRARGVAVLFGGLTPATSGETWEWDGTNWTQRLVLGAPSPRSDHAMAYDAARGVTVLFGGFAVARSAETWEWDGAIWSMRMPAPAPSARDALAMAYDSARRVSVLFGGNTGAGRNGETWEWTGPKPAILLHPSEQTVAAGQPTVFSVTASGPGTLSYFWGKDGAELSDGDSITGSKTATLTIDPATVEDSGVYACIVVNSCGNTRSRDAALVVDPCLAVDATGDCDGNGVLDTCDIAADATLDADGDGTLDSCDMGCGMCGAGVPMMMPLALLGLGRLRRRRGSRSYYKKERIL